MPQLSNTVRRSREAIVAAMRELMDERGVDGFTVEELAQRAGVARRTVFNLFGTLDQLALEVCSAEVVQLVGEVAVPFDEERDRGTPFAAIADVIVTMDLASAMSRIVSWLGGAERLLEEPRLSRLLQAAFSRMTVGIVEGSDAPLSSEHRVRAEILTSAIIGGLSAVAVRWIAETGAQPTPEARSRWNEKVDILIDVLREGFAPRPSR